MALKRGDHPKVSPHTPKGCIEPAKFRWYDGIEEALHLLSRYFVGICRSEATNYGAVDQINGRFSTQTVNSTNQRVVRGL